MYKKEKRIYYLGNNVVVTKYEMQYNNKAYAKIIHIKYFIIIFFFNIKNF